MTPLNHRRIALSALAGTVAWSIWTSAVTMNFMLPIYKTDIAAGRLLSVPRYGLGLFFSSWLLMLLAVSALSAWFYAALRPRLGSGLKPAAMVGAILGFIAAVPIDLSVSNWASLSGTIPLGWTVDTWIGVTLATCVASLVYKDPQPVCTVESGGRDAA